MLFTSSPLTAIAVRSVFSSAPGELSAAVRSSSRNRDMISARELAPNEAGQRAAVYAFGVAARNPKAKRKSNAACAELFGRDDAAC